MPEVRFNVAGRVALVTGGGSGIGRAIALGLAGIGIHVGVADRDPDRVTNATVAIENCASRAYGLVADVRRQADVQRLVAEVKRAPRADRYSCELPPEYSLARRWLRCPRTSGIKH